MPFTTVLFRTSLVTHGGLRSSVFALQYPVEHLGLLALLLLLLNEFNCVTYDVGLRNSAALRHAGLGWLLGPGLGRNGRHSSYYIANLRD